MESLAALTVAVVMGGPSEEHAVSLKSGQGIVEALTRRGGRAQAIVIPKTLSVLAACAALERAVQAARPDIAFLALHGTFGEDGTVQELLERLRISYTGSDAAASRLGMDKVASRRRFQAAGLTVPRWQVMGRADLRSPPLTGWTFPLVVKPTNQGSSLGVSVVRRQQELGAAIADAARFDSRILIEEFIGGRELTVGVLGDEALPIVEIRPHQSFFDYAAKYTAGMTDYLVPASLEPGLAARVQATGRAAHRALGCRHLSRTDLLLNDRQEPVVLEVNTIPGFTPTSLLPKAAACAGVLYDELCERVVWMAWQGAAHTAVHS